MLRKNVHRYRPAASNFRDFRAFAANTDVPARPWTDCVPKCESNKSLSLERRASVRERKGIKGGNSHLEFIRDHQNCPVVVFRLSVFNASVAPFHSDEKA